jgi:soluble lytic murein transglycosylase-like protein
MLSFFSPASLWAAAELSPVDVAFAYKIHHAAAELPAGAVDALRPAADDEPSLIDEAPVAPTPKPKRTFSRRMLCDTAASVAEANNLPVPFFANLIQQESGFQPHVVSSAGAQGIAQFMPRTAVEHGLVNPFDPIHALAVSAKFLRSLLAQFGNLGLAAAAYNAGPRRVGDWLTKRGKLPTETRNYVQNVTGKPAEHWVRPRAKAEELRLPAHARCPGLESVEARTIPGIPPDPKAIANLPPSTTKGFALASANASKNVQLKIMIGEAAMKPAALAALAKKQGATRVSVASAKKPTAVIASARKPTPGVRAVAQKSKAPSKTVAQAKANTRTASASTKVAGKSHGKAADQKPAPRRQAPTKKVKVAATR